MWCGGYEKGPPCRGWAGVLVVGMVRAPWVVFHPRGPLASVGCGGVLLSHILSGAVPSPCQVLTSGFGMGPGVSPGPWPPQDYTRLTQDCSVMPGDGLGTGQGRGVVRVMRFGTSSCIVRGCRDVPPPGVGVCVSRRPVSTGRLHPSRGFHVRPIDHVFCMGGHQPTMGLQECLSWSRLPA